MKKKRKAFRNTKSPYRLGGIGEGKCTCARKDALVFFHKQGCPYYVG